MMSESGGGGNGGSSSSNGGSKQLFQQRTVVNASAGLSIDPPSKILGLTADNLLSTVHHEDDSDRRSSSTEGPDSPGHSTSSSPVPLMLPPGSPYRRVVGRGLQLPPGGSSSDGAYLSHPFSEVDLQNQLPRFHIKVSEDVMKDADVVKYRIKVRRLSENPEEVFSIERQYEDFEFLHHNLTTQNDITGLIVPPLPPRPAVDPKSTEARSHRQLGSSSRSMRGDDFAKDAKVLERYLHGLLLHPVFGMDPRTSEFLAQQVAPERSKIKKGLFSGVRQSLESHRKHSTKDEDESFQKERDWAASYGNQIKDVCDRFQNVINARLRLANQISHLATCLNASVGGNEGANAFYNRLNSRFSGCLEQDRSSAERVLSREDKTLGSHLSLWTSYLDSENAMLLRRTLVMLEKDSAAKAFQKVASSKKAAGNKAEQLRITKEDKESEFELVSSTATLEIKRFHQRRILEMKESIVHYTEAQIDCARAAKEELAKCVIKMKDFPLPTHPAAGATIDGATGLQ